jgi:hypothetical protein
MSLEAGDRGVPATQFAQRCPMASLQGRLSSDRAGRRRSAPRDTIRGMEFAEVVRRRRMVRHYSDRPLAPEVVKRVLASALPAPSAGFSQGWAFLALTDSVDRARFWPFVPTRVAQTPTMQDAPLVRFWWD